MLNQLLKFTLVSSLLLWLKPRWRSLLALVVFVVLVHVLHAEYLGYVELSDNQAFLLWSYALKWLMLILGVSLYCLYTFSHLPVGRRDKKPEGRKKKQPIDVPTVSKSALPADDGFDFLRQKEQLQSRAEKLLAGDVDTH